MIRGSIEVAQRARVAGWIFASAESVRDKVILAFVGPRCVGAGKVDRFRKDLLDAKLGDGYCGFDFAIKLQDGERLGAVIVKLQNSDVALIQRTSQLTGPEDCEVDESLPDLGAIPPERISWMQERGWLDQHEYDFLKAIHTIGAYERGLRPARRAGTAAVETLKPDVAVSDLLGLFSMSEVEVSRADVNGVSDLAAAGSPLRAENGLPVVALWSPERCRIALDERSHIGPIEGRRLLSPAGSPGAIEYGFGPDRLLFLHRDASFAPSSVAPAQGITVFAAKPKPAGMVLPVARNRVAA